MIKFKDQVQLQKISDDAWIVNDAEKRVGILHKTIQDKFTYLDKTETVLFENKKEVQDFFKNAFVFEEGVELDITQPATFYIKGYAVDYPIQSLTIITLTIWKRFLCLQRLRIVRYIMRQVGMLSTLKKAGNMVTVLN